MILVLTILWMLFIHIYWNYTDNHIYLISMPFMGYSRLVIGEGSHGSNPESYSARPQVADIRGVPILYICPTLFPKISYIRPIFK